MTTEFLENIAKFACNYYMNNVPKRGKPEASKKEWTTLAVIVQTENKLSPKVVAFGTGTKCLGQSELSFTGELLSDSHAEVIARRCFQRYLYHQIQSFISSAPTCILHPISEGKFSLKHGFQFHFFISHVPCGDAAIFVDPVTSVSDIVLPDDQPEAKKPKLDSNHRTGAKLVNTSVRYEELQTEGQCRTKPGKGDPTLSMSCSDKLAKWMLLGLQGNLLGLLIPEKIVFTSIIIGGSQRFSEPSLRRAIYGRYNENSREEVSSLAIYQSHVNFMEILSNGKPAPASLFGYHTSGLAKMQLEVSVDGRRQGVTKKNFSKPSARVSICRMNMSLLFLETLSKLTSHPLQSNLPPSPTYSQLKARNTTYVTRWNDIRTKLMLGWTIKPESTKNFLVNIP